MSWRRSCCCTRTRRSFDRAFCSKLREGSRDPDVGVVGCAGAVGVRSMAWWEGSITWASFNHRYEEFGGGESPRTRGGEGAAALRAMGEVDTVDGFLLALSPWMVRNVRFDESLGQLLHGYDFDFCLQVRAAGGRFAPRTSRSCTTTRSSWPATSTVDRRRT